MFSLFVKMGGNVVFQIAGYLVHTCPVDFFLFENEYPEFSDEPIDRAMKVMDSGFQAQDYYSRPYKLS